MRKKNWKKKNLRKKKFEEKNKFVKKNFEGKKNSVWTCNIFQNLNIEKGKRKQLVSGIYSCKLLRITVLIMPCDEKKCMSHQSYANSIFKTLMMGRMLKTSPTSI